MHQLFLGSTKCRSHVRECFYFNIALEVVKESCTFKTFTDFTPPPEVLETETEVLLANVNMLWRFNCDHDQFVPQDLVGGKYAMMLKEYLCHCKGSMEDIVLSCSLQYCEGGIKLLSLTYTVNQAVLAFNPEFAKGLNLQKPVELEAPVYLEIKKIDVIRNQHKQIVWQLHGGKALKGLLTKQNQTQKVFADTATYAHKNLKNITLDTKWSLHKLWKFLKYGGITASVVIPILAIVAGVAYFLLRRKMTTFTITKTPEFV